MNHDAQYSDTIPAPSHTAETLRAPSDPGVCPTIPAEALAPESERALEVDGQRHVYEAALFFGIPANPAPDLTSALKALAEGL